MVAPQAGGWPHTPGITSDAQIAIWKKIVDAVHANGAYIYLQLWAMGRAADPANLAETDPTFKVVAPSPIPITGRGDVPHELTVEEIRQYVDWYRQAAINAVEKAGFDGANGYLPDQFLQEQSNKRTDQYGGSIENRARFPLEILEAVVGAVGQERTALRISPWSLFQDMRMEDPKPTFAHLITKVKERYPNFAYIHAIEPRILGDTVVKAADTDSNNFLREIWKPRPFIAAGGFDADSAAKGSDENGDLIAFGRLYISNVRPFYAGCVAPADRIRQPDLPLRLKSSIPLTAADRKDFYALETPVGYTDYPFASA